MLAGAIFSAHGTPGFVDHSVVGVLLIQFIQNTEGSTVRAESIAWLTMLGTDVTKKQ